MRATKGQLEKLKEKYNIETIWSWSRYNTYKNDPYSYMLKYINHIRETKENIYSYEGGRIHEECMEDFYNGKIKYEDIPEIYEQIVFDANMKELKYNRKDEVANRKIGDKYEECIRLFCKQHIPIKTKMIIEQFITVKIGEYLFQGYIDALTKDEEGFYNIIDWKTSTMYSGQKVIKESGQLVLYAEILIQKGIDINKIKICWNFLKYCIIEQQLKSFEDKEKTIHKIRETKCLRNEWVSKVSTNLRMWLKQDGLEEFEIDELVSEAIKNNNLRNMPAHIIAKYKMKDCYVYIHLTQELVDNLKTDIIATLDEIGMLEKTYEVTKDDRLFWTHIDKQNEFFFANLMSYSAKVHKPWKEYLEDQNMFGNQKKVKEEKDEDWMNELLGDM